MKAGDPLALPLKLTLTSDGSGLSYANAAAFLADGWVITWQTATGGALTTPTYTLAPVAGDTTGLHWLTITTPATDFRFAISAPSGKRTNIVGGMVPIEAQDVDTVYALLTSTQGVASVTFGPAAPPWEVVEGDSFNRSVTLAASTIADMGWSNLSGVTLTSAIRATSDSTTGSPLATPTATSDNVLTVSVAWDAWPSGLDLSAAERAAGQAVRYIEVQGRKSGKTRTLVKGTLTIRRQEDRT